MRVSEDREKERERRRPQGGKLNTSGQRNSEPSPTRTRALVRYRGIWWLYMQISAYLKT